MPYSTIKFFIFVTSFAFLGCQIASIPSQARHSPITTYYIRYNEKFIKNQIMDTDLLMVPAAENLKKENFSWISVQSVINVTPVESNNQKFKMARDKSLKQILLEHGLKSVNSYDNETLISYEGMVKRPVRINALSKSTRTEFHFKADINFCPLPFPGEEQHSHLKSLFYNTLDDFFELFK